MMVLGVVGILTLGQHTHDTEEKLSWTLPSAVGCPPPLPPVAVSPLSVAVTPLSVAVAVTVSPPILAASA